MTSFLFLSGRDFNQVLISTRTDVFLLLHLLLLESFCGCSEIPTISLGQFLLDLIPESILEVVFTGAWVDEIFLFLETRFGRMKWNMLPWVVNLLSKSSLRFILSWTNICQLVLGVFKPLT